MSLVATFAVAVGAVVVATPVLSAIARSVGLVDVPGPLKVHRSPVPVSGGAAVGCGLAVAMGIEGQWEQMVPLGMALALGVMDDRRPLSPWTRLAVQTGVGVAVAALEPVRLPGALGPALTVCATVLLVNAFNLIDGLDGLASGVGVACSAGFGLLLSGHAQAESVALMGSTLGFLFYNRPPARAFLGDGGSYLIGAAVSEVLARSWSPGQTWSTSVAALLAVGYPATEVAFSVLRRWRGRTGILRGDRGHVYDRIVAAGWPPWAASLACVLGQLCLSALAPGVAASGTAGAVAGTGAVAAAIGALGARAGLVRPRNEGGGA